jgi:N-acyl-D-aspartate/D-glutamate deacylase
VSDDLVTRDGHVIDPAGQLGGLYQIGIRDGRVREGCDADLVLINRAPLTDRATFAEPDLLQEGPHAVIVS